MRDWKPRTERQVHEVEKGSNLDLILRGTNGAINKLAGALERGLTAVALALSTPEDNAEQVKQFIDTLKAVTDPLDTAVQDNQPENKEN